MVIRYRYVIYKKDKLCLKPLAIKVRRIYIANRVSYKKKIERGK